MHAEAIAIGSEILTGDCVDTNLMTLANTLAGEGIALAQHTIVPDEREALGRALAGALGRGPLVVMTGGLGATPDDVTRRVMASVLGRKLIYRESLLEALRAKYAQRGLVLSPAAEAMALVPSGAQPLENAIGLAPGLMLRTEKSLLFALPGVPAEMEHMLVDEVLPVLRQEGLLGRCQSETLRTAGLSETSLADCVRPLLGEGVRCSYLPAPGRVDLTLRIADRDRDGRQLMATIERIRERLGPVLYATGRQGLAATDVALLVQRGLGLGAAESLTGGQLGAALTAVPGASRVFQGTVVAYDNRAKEDLLGVSGTTLQSQGAVSARTAEEMAAGARHVLRADVALATTGIAGPSGGSAEKPVGLVYFGLCDARSCRSLRCQFGGSRAQIQERSVTMALNMLRLCLIDRLDLLWDGARAARGPGGRRGAL